MATWDFTAWNDEIPKMDLLTRGLDQLLAQYGPDNAPRLRAWLATVLYGEATIGAVTGPTGVQSIEEVAYQLLALRSIYTATGVNLDVLGRLLGLERNAYAADDEIYRLLLLIKIMVNRSEATWDEINAMIVRLGLTLVSEWEHWPAVMRTTVADMPADPAGDAIWDLFRKAKAAGVLWRWVWSTYPEDEVFRYSSQLDTTESSATHGYGNLAAPPTTGGHYAGDLS